ncbi:hypothetical protein [Gorillibacterium sp. sgz5001074]|uniref:hypothetical protein n=1 Tax=Gorillibacterium sp. sgz5001074 TaxID=3446695 RepID=UPI003F67211C
MFKMTLNQKDGILVISYSGYFTVYDAKLFQRELEQKIRNIRPEEYVLIIDMHEIRLSKQDLAPLLDEIKRTYTDAPFRYIFAVDAEGWIAKVKRKDLERDNWQVVPSVDDALSRVRRGLCPIKKDAGHTT